MAQFTIIPNGQWRVVYDDSLNIIQFTNKGETHTSQNVVVASKSECEAAIENLGLTYPE